MSEQESGPQALANIGARKIYTTNRDAICAAISNAKPCEFAAEQGLNCGGNTVLRGTLITSRCTGPIDKAGEVAVGCGTSMYDRNTAVLIRASNV
jgi:hypothetical protein